MKIPYDKKLHFLCGCIIAMLVGLYNPLYGLLAGVVAGVAKEVYDYFDYGLADKYDMLATWAGALIGTCLCLVAKL